MTCKQAAVFNGNGNDGAAHPLIHTMKPTFRHEPSTCHIVVDVSSFVVDPESCSRIAIVLW